MTIYEIRLFAGGASIGMVAGFALASWVMLSFKTYTKKITGHTMTEIKIKPYLKWSGGKARSADTLRDLLGRGPCEGTYIEPFAGALAVYLARAADGEIRRAILADAQPHLIACHRMVRDRVEDVIKMLRALPADESWTGLYPHTVTAMNAQLPGTPIQAARFIWLNKACFNGLCRVNMRGEFNTPIGKYARLSLPSDELLRETSRLLQPASLLCCDFGEVIRMAGDGDQLLVDPPYDPLSKSSGFVEYTKGKFKMEDHIRLAKLCRSAGERGARSVLCNNSTKRIVRLYSESGFKNYSYQVGRSGGAKGKGGAVKELYAVAGPA